MSQMFCLVHSSPGTEGYVLTALDLPQTAPWPVITHNLRGVWEEGENLATKSRSVSMFNLPGWQPGPCDGVLQDQILYLSNWKSMSFKRTKLFLRVTSPSSNRVSYGNWNFLSGKRGLLCSKMGMPSDTEYLKKQLMQQQVSIVPSWRQNTFKFLPINTHFFSVRITVVVGGGGGRSSS